MLLIPVPGTSAIHDLWAGTKLLVVFGVSVLLTFYPGWVTIGLVAALVLAAARIAHIPRGALPSVPRWLWIVLALGGSTAALAGGSPVLSIGGLEIGLGGTLNFLRHHRAVDRAARAGGDGVLDHQRRRNRACVGDFGPPAAAIADSGRRMGGGFGARAARLPDVDRRIPGALRRSPAAAQTHPASRKARRRQARLELIDLLAAAITVTLRRADEMGDAITARGGIGQLSANPARPKLADWVTLADHYRGQWCSGGDRDDIPRLSRLVLFRRVA